AGKIGQTHEIGEAVGKGQGDGVAGTMNVEEVIAVASQDAQIGTPVVIRPEGALGLIDVLNRQKHVDAPDLEEGRLADGFEPGNEIASGADLICQFEFTVHRACGVTSLDHHNSLVRRDGYRKRLRLGGNTDAVSVALAEVRISSLPENDSKR